MIMKKQKYTIKIKSRSGIVIEDAPDSLFPSKCMKDCEDNVIKYVKKRCPDWINIIIVKDMVYVNGKSHTQRHFIERATSRRELSDLLMNTNMAFL